MCISNIKAAKGIQGLGASLRFALLTYLLTYFFGATKRRATTFNASFQNLNANLQNLNTNSQNLNAVSTALRFCEFALRFCRFSLRF